jgi:hypothetical protein
VIAGIGLQWLEFKASAELFMGLCLLAVLALVGIVELIKKIARKIAAFFKK